MKQSIYLIACLLICYNLYAQPGGRPTAGRQMPTGAFYGKIIDSRSQKPIEFASVQIIQNRFDSLTKKRKDVAIAGMLTKANGEFRVENIPVFGTLKLRVSVVGFQPYEQAVSFELKPGNMSAADMTAMMAALDKDLGNIRIDVAEKVLENVTVTGSKPGLQLGIDRKVFNVDRNLVSAGGTAVDIMRNIPSLSVDLDGNVTMRNNSPQVFVDGRPTTMSLEQIPADAIESVELITNPSAKYDASGGTAGILNVVLKKNKRVGYSGSMRTNIDSRARIGFGGDINVRQNKVNMFFSANYNQRKSISNTTTDRTTLIGTPNTFLKQTDRSVQVGYFAFLRGGLDFFIDNRNTLSLSGNRAEGRFTPTGESDILIDSLYSAVKSSFSERLSENMSRFENNGVTLSYKHNFPRKGEELTADVNYNGSRNRTENLITNNYYILPAYTFSNAFRQQQNGRGENQNLVIQTDYERALSDKSKLEMGLRAQIRTVENRNDFFFLSPSGEPVYNPLLSINYNSTDHVYAAYTTFSNRIKDFGYQLGLRMESSDYVGRLPDKDQEFNIDFPVSLFPSVFLSQKLKKEQDLQLNYTRKINRPNFFQLYPFTDYSDSLNISRGNPDLRPEFTNSFELSYQKTFKNKDNFIASAYYKRTTGLITRFQTREMNPVDNKEMLVNTFINANSAYVTGLELVSKNKLTKAWELVANFNLFTSRINLNDPTLPDPDQFASWFLKLNNTFKLPKNFSIQLSGEYQSRTVLPPGGSGGGGFGGGGGRMGGMFGGGGMMWGQTSVSQGYTRDNYFIDLGVRFEFLKNRQASVSLNMSDVLRTRRQDIFSESPDFTQNVFRRRDPQLLRLNFSWRFGKFDPSLFKRKSNKNLDNGAGDMMNMGN